MKKKVLIGLAAVAVLLFAGVGVSLAQYQLLLNGGAEDDLSPEWVTISGLFGRSMSNGPVNPYSGSWMFDAGPSATYSALQQGINVTPYDWFCAGGYMYNGSNDEGQMRVDFYDGGGGYIADQRTGRISNPDYWGWEQLCGPIPLTAATADLTVQGFRVLPVDIHTFYDDLFFDAWDLLLYLTPEEDTNAVGSMHELCLDIDADPPEPDMSGLPVVFAGWRDPTAAQDWASPVIWTDGDGVACFTYSSDVVGTEEIYAWIDYNEDGGYDNVEPYAGPVWKHWEVEFVPEWGSIALLGSGLMGMAGYASLRLRKR
jgi:hypothetical protein